MKLTRAGQRIAPRFGGATLILLLAALAAGCSGINGSKSISPLDFLLPGLSQNPSPSPAIPGETNPVPWLAQANPIAR